MFNRDTWQEIWMALKQNKLRTLLTGFAIAWGIFMLFILSSFGFGFQKSMLDNFKDSDKNVVEIYGGSTSIPYKGHPTDRFLSFTDNDWNILRQNPSVDELCYEAQPDKSCTAVYEKQTATINVSGVYPIYQEINNLKIKSGRFLSNQDITSNAKVAVISSSMLAELYKNGQNPIGTYITILSLPYQVIGVFDNSEWSQNSYVYLPFDIVKRTFHVKDYYQLSFTTKGIETEEQFAQFKDRLFATLARYHEVSPDDKNAFWINGTIANKRQVSIATSAIQVFIWLICIAMLVSGITGVGNIMLVTVKERTNEIGIRKALGAKPSVILQSILMESLFITVLFGIIGMILGAVVILVINFVMGNMPESTFTQLMHPIINFGTTFGALFILIISGVLAGYFPARKAVKIKPIEAIQSR